jgi:hypothetical protein
MLLWSVDPGGDNPTDIFSVGIGSRFRIVVSLVQNTKSSVVLHQSTGALSGTFPLIDNGFVTQEASGDLPYSADEYVETMGPDGQVLSTFGAPTSGETASTPGRDGSSTTQPKPWRAWTGPSNRRPGLHRRGDLARWPVPVVDHPPGSARRRRREIRALRVYLILPGGPPFNSSGDSISQFSLVDPESGGTGGGIFAFGDATYFGSAGSLALNASVTGLTPRADGAGYWIVTSDGGVFAYGDAPLVGSAPGTSAGELVVGIAAS